MSSKPGRKAEPERRDVMPRQNISLLERKRDGAFTLIELLVVIAILSVLLALLMPVLGRARGIARRLRCASNLRQISSGWMLYLNDFDGFFYQGLSANVRFGGWIGEYGQFLGWWPRPINPYLFSDPEGVTEDSATIFSCPADRGGLPGPFVPPAKKVYEWYGNSYGANLLLADQDSIPTGSEDPNRAALYGRIMPALSNMNLSKVTNPHEKTILVGDHGWGLQFRNDILLGEDTDGRVSLEWHGKQGFYNVAFLAGNVAYLKIEHGQYLTDDYYVLPFKQFNPLAQAVWNADRQAAGHD